MTGENYKFGEWYSGDAPDQETAWYMYHNEYDAQQLYIWQLFCEYKTDRTKRFKFEVIPAKDLVKTWNDYAAFGKADKDMVDQFETQMVINLAQLEVHNALSGHATHCGFREIADLEEITISEEDEQLYYESDFGVHDTEGDIISDYGLPQLKALVTPMLCARTPEEKLVVIDRMLNVCHMRGDLAAFFVEGGSKTLNFLFEPTKQEEEEEERAYV